MSSSLSPVRVTSASSISSGPSGSMPLAAARRATFGACPPLIASMIGCVDIGAPGRSAAAPGLHGGRLDDFFAPLRLTPRRDEQSYLPQHFLYFFPEPHGQVSLRRTFGSVLRIVFGPSSSPAALAP